MFGYLRPVYKKMDPISKKQYRSFYCGLCHALSDQYRIKGLLSLNYEVTAFLVVVHGLLEQPVKTYYGSCTITPFVWVPYLDHTESTLIMAASISALMIETGLEDHIKDGDRKRFEPLSLLKKLTSSKRYGVLQELRLRTQDSLEGFYQEEDRKDSSFQELVQKCGILSQCMFAPLIDLCREDCRDRLMRLADLLGRWIYVIDACDDRLSDQKEGKPNPLFRDGAPLNEIDVFFEDVEREIGECLRGLPFIRYTELIRYLFGTNMRDKRERILQKLFQAL